MLPLGSTLGSVTVLFIISVTVYYLFKIEIVLGFRRAFPIFYTNKDLDGKLYDAYVAYLQRCVDGFSEEMDMFALHTLPQVLEKACGYKLFITGRDCLPGRAIIDSVHENIQASRRILLLYTASTFTTKCHAGSSSQNNNYISKSSDIGEGIENKDVDSLDESNGVHSDTKQRLECVVAMHRALLEGSLKVVLVELEEVTPAQLALFPEAVRYLRKKQGAVCYWKNQRTWQRWRTCMRKENPSLSPSSSFWKEIRFHMPVRGKRVVYPENTALLNV